MLLKKNTFCPPRLLERKRLLSKYTAHLMLIVNITKRNLSVGNLQNQLAFYTNIVLLSIHINLSV